MNENISQRIVRDLGVSDLTEILSNKLSGSDLSSLLLTVIKRRVGKIDAAKLALPNPVTKACDLDARLLNKVEGIFYETAASYDAVELSPLSPLGSVAVLSGLDQGNVLSSTRAFETVSDPTIGLALEFARRRKSQSDRKNLMRLCCSQRVLRFPLPQNPAYTAHFKLLSLVAAGRDMGSFALETLILREQIGLYLSLLSNLEPLGFVFKDIEVELADTRVLSHLCELMKICKDEIRSTVRARDSNRFVLPEY